MWIDGRHLKGKQKCATSVTNKQDSGDYWTCSQKFSLQARVKDLTRLKILLIIWKKKKKHRMNKSQGLEFLQQESIKVWTELKIVWIFLTSNIHHLVELKLRSSSGHLFHWGNVWYKIVVDSAHLYLKDVIQNCYDNFYNKINGKNYGVRKGTRNVPEQQLKRWRC